VLNRYRLLIIAGSFADRVINFLHVAWLRDLTVSSYQRGEFSIITYIIILSLLKVRLHTAIRRVGTRQFFDPFDYN
jgi:hypothetical protein